MDRYGRKPEEVVRAFLVAVTAGDKERAKSFYNQESIDILNQSNFNEYDPWNVIGKYAQFKSAEMTVKLGIGGAYRVSFREGGKSRDAVLSMMLLDDEWRLVYATKSATSGIRLKPEIVDTNAVRKAIQARYTGLLADAKRLEQEGTLSEALHAARKAAYFHCEDAAEARALLARAEKRAEPHSDRDVSLDLVSSVGAGATARITMDFVWIESLKMWVGKYEVTNEEYRQYRADHSTDMYRGSRLNGDHQPVVEVDYDEAVAYAEWVNTTAKLPDGYRVRLPDGTEWLAFAQCGTDRAYPWGDKFPVGYGNYADQMAMASNNWHNGIPEYNDGYAVSCPVDDSGMNDWGLYGVGGNVWEWTSELYDSTNGQRLLRGGSWRSRFSDALGCTSHRTPYLLDRSDAVGFRLVLARREDIGVDH